MKKFFKEVAKLLIAVLLGLVYMWFALSFAWSLDDMSMVEKLVGVVYTAIVMPLYYGIKKVLRLQ